MEMEQQLRKRCWACLKAIVPSQPWEQLRAQKQLAIAMIECTPQSPSYSSNWIEHLTARTTARGRHPIVATVRVYTNIIIYRGTYSAGDGHLSQGRLGDKNCARTAKSRLSAY